MDTATLKNLYYSMHLKIWCLEIACVNVSFSNLQGLMDVQAKKKLISVFKCIFEAHKY